MSDRIDDEDVLLPHVWAVHARFRADQPALICGERTLTWAELNAAANRIAHGLLARGVTRGAKVALLMSNSIEMVEVMMGVIKAGACLTPLSTLLTSQQVGVLLADSGAETLIVSSKARHLVDPAGPGFAVALVASDFQEPGWLTLDELTEGASEREPVVRYASNDLFSIIYSSGTTGLPKGIAHTHRARRHWSWSNGIEMAFTHDSVSLITTALYSNGTWFMWLSPLMLGATMVLMEQFSPDGFLRLVEKHRVTHTFIVPAQCLMVVGDPACGKHDTSSLRMVLSAGSALRREVREAVEQRLTPHVYELYGYSEGFSTIIGPREAALKPGSVGRPVTGFDFRIVDDAGAVLPVGEAGEITGGGGGAMVGYYGKPEATEALIWRDEIGRTFMRSGDIGRIDEDGFLYVLDRKKDMILSGSFNVFPADIEAIVAQHPDVADVTVIGVPHPKWEQTPLALVIRRDGASGSETEILEWANERLAKPQRLTAVEFRDEFPRNALGKVLKRDLRKRYWLEEVQ